MFTMTRGGTPALGLVAHLGHGVQRIATDATIGQIRKMPRQTSDLDAAWLSRLLGSTVETVAILQKSL